MNRRDFVSALAVIAVAPTLVGRRVLAQPSPTYITFDWSRGYSQVIWEPLRSTTIVDFANGRDGYVYRVMFSDPNGQRISLPYIRWMGGLAPEVVEQGKALIIVVWCMGDHYFGQWVVAE